MNITLVTGNKGKLTEWQRLLPETFQLDAVDIDLPEIQTIDLTELVTDKVKRAYEAVGRPVIVEDVWAGLDALSGLPGPFIKFFEKKLGRDALYQLAEKFGSAAAVHCGAAYYDGHEIICVETTVLGTVVEPRGENGFGFDICFVPDGALRTYGEMSPGEKDTVSHRSKVVALLAERLAGSRP